ncbi:hypothetical protein EJB05_48063, partial [Eragrostis curvula]
MWQEFLKKVTSFCEKHKVKVVDIDGKYIPMQRSKQFYRGAMNYHRFHADMFLFSSGSFKLRLCFPCLVIFIIGVLIFSNLFVIGGFIFINRFVLLSDFFIILIFLVLLR